METSEAREKRLIKHYLRRHGAYWHMPVKATRFGVKTVDMLVCFYGLFVAIEVKAPYKEPTKLQWGYMREVVGARGIALWGTTAAVIKELEAVRELIGDARPGPGCAGLPDDGPGTDVGAS
jgi:hypothetical protein